MHDTVQSAEGEEGGRRERERELAALMSHPFQKAAGSQKHFEKNHWVLLSFFLSFFLFLFLHPSLPVARILAAAAVLPFWGFSFWLFCFFKKSASLLFLSPLGPSGAAVLFRVWTLSVCLSVCLSDWLTDWPTAGRAPLLVAVAETWALFCFKSPPQANRCSFHAQVTVRDRRTLPLPLPVSPSRLLAVLPPPPLQSSSSSLWLMRSKGSDHIKHESASTLPQ